MASATAPSPTLVTAVAALVTRGNFTLHGFQPEVTNIKPKLTESGRLLHVFEFDPQRAKLVLAWLSKKELDDDYMHWTPLPWDRMIHDLRKKTGLPQDSLVIDDYIGRYSLRLAVRDYEHVERVLDTAMALWTQCCFTLATKLAPCYEPGVRFSVEKSEELFVERTTQWGEGSDSYLASDSSKAALLADERLWKSEKGKQWARSFHQRHRIALERDTDADHDAKGYDILMRTVGVLGERFDWPLMATAPAATETPPSD